MVIIQLADQEAEVLLKLAKQRFKLLDKRLLSGKPNTDQHGNRTEYLVAAGAISALEFVLNASIRRSANFTI